MMNKLGRNDLCACGSGKKFKKCCIEKGSSNFEVADFDWRKLRQMEGMIVDRHLFPYVTHTLPEDVIKSALVDFLPEDSDYLEEWDWEAFYNHFFIHWFLFNWIPFDDFGVMEFDSEITIAQNYLQFHEKNLSDNEKRFIEAMDQTYYSFYSVVGVEKNKSLQVKDILLGITHTIKEKQGTHQLKRGDVVLSRILTLGEQSIFVGMVPFLIPTRFHQDLFDFKKWLIEEYDNLELDVEILRDAEHDLFGYFFEMLKIVHEQPFPKLVNTDGDLLLFSKSYFKINATPEEILNRLLPLTLSDNEADFLEEAERNQLGDIERLEFPWIKTGNKKHKNWDNTIMGHFTIEQNKLILETNSEKRTKLGKELLQQYLGETISFQNTLMETPEQKLKSSPSEQDKEKENLLESPEVQEKISEFVKSHWDSWFDVPVPALKNKTPREAVKTVEGKERLEALLLQYERHNAERQNNLLKVDINYLKSELGLE